MQERWTLTRNDRVYQSSSLQPTPPLTMPTQLARCPQSASSCLQSLNEHGDYCKLLVPQSHQKPHGPGGKQALASCVSTAQWSGHGGTTGIMRVGTYMQMHARAHVVVVALGHTASKRGVMTVTGQPWRTHNLRVTMVHGTSPRAQPTPQPPAMLLPPLAWPMRCSHMLTGRIGHG